MRSATDPNRRRRLPLLLLAAALALAASLIGRFFRGHPLLRAPHITATKEEHGSPPGSCGSRSGSLEYKKEAQKGPLTCESIGAA